MSATVPYLGQVVYHCRDEHGVIDVVAEGDGKLRSLQFGTTARQSTMFVDRPDDLALEYTRCLMTALLFLEADPRRVLLLGLGGGSLAKFLLRRCEGCRVDVVELRPRIVEVAERFFGVPMGHERLRVHVADGRQFLLASEGDPYDLILVDLHSSQGMSPVVLEPDFLPACRRLTAAEGVLSANMWYGVDEASERTLRLAVEASYDTTLYLPVAGKRNCVAHGLLRRALPPGATLESRARSWQERAGLPLPELLAQVIRHNAGRLDPDRPR